MKIHKFCLALILACFVHAVFAASPLVTAFTPSTGATNQPINPSLKIQFDQNVIPKLGFIRIRRYNNNALIETIAATSAKVTGANSRTITITPNTLALGTRYYVEIDSAAFSNVTNEFYSGTVDRDTWNFTTYIAGGELRLWLDASDTDSITLDGSNNIMEWRDLSGYDYHLTQDTVSRRPRFHTVTQSGKPQVRFVNDFLENVNSTVPIVEDTSRMTFFVVHAPEIASNRTLFSTNKIYAHMNQLQSFSPNVNTSMTLPTRQMVTTYEFFGSSMTVYNDSVVTAQNNSQAIADDIETIRLGSRGFGTGLSTTYRGKIQELRIYSEVFSESERLAIEQELYDKWMGTPKEHSDLLMWFDASDEKTYDFTPASKINNWINRADNRVDAYKETGISAPIMVDNGRDDLSTFRASADDSLRIDYALPEAGKTVFFVAQSEVNSNALHRTFFTPSTQAHHSVRINNRDFIYGDAITEPEDSVWRVHRTVYSGSNVEVFSNAVFVDSQNYTLKGTGPYVTIGDQDKGFKGEIGELIVYDRVLNDDEITDIEVYLTDKWDLKAFFVEELFVDDDADNASQDQTFHMLFSKDFIFGSTGKLYLRRMDDNSLVKDFTVSSPDLNVSGPYLYITVTGLDSDTEYYFEMDADFVESVDGTPFAGFNDNTTWNFKTLPFDIEGLVLWLDADDDTSFNLTSDDRVVSWFDKSDQQRETTQTNNTYRPTRIDYDRKVGMKVLNANNRFLDLINGDLATYDIFQVFKTGVSSDFVNSEAIVGAKSSSLRTYMTQSRTNTFNSSNAPGEVYQDGKLVTDNTLLDLDDFTAVYTEARNPGTARGVYINRREGTRGYTHLAEILVFDRKKSAANRDGIFQYLMEKWDLTGPKIISSTPVDNETNLAVSVANNITLNFDRDVFKGANGSVQIRASADDSTVATLPIASPSITIVGSSVTVNFGTTLSNDTDYYLYIEDDSFVDANGFSVKKYDEKVDFLNFKTVAAAPGAFSVKDINGLQLWFDIADYSTLDFSSGSTVQGIKDKSGNQRDASQSTNSYRAVINSIHQNGHDVLTNFDDFYYLDNSMYKAVDIFQVFRAPYNAFDYYGSFSGARVSSQRDYLFNYRNSNFHTQPADSYYKDSVLLSTNSLMPIDEFMLLETITTNTHKRDYQFARQEGYRFMSYVGEYIVFDRKLDTAERDLITDYLIRKWKISPLKLLSSNPADNQVNVDVNTNIELTFNIPVYVGNGNLIIRNSLTGAAIQTYNMLSTSITQSSPEVIQFNLGSALAYDTAYYIEIEEGAFETVQGYDYIGFNGSSILNFKTADLTPGDFEPDDFNGLELWLDAQDLGTLTTTGSLVTNWEDKSLNARDAYMTNNTYRPRHDAYVDKFGNPYLTFTNDYMELQNNDFVGKNIFYVYRSQAYLFNTYGAVLGARVAAERPYLYRTGAQRLHSNWYPEQIYVDGDDHVVSANFDYLKRPQVHMVQPYLSNNVRDFRVGASEGYRANMQIGEIIAYNRDLSDSERNEITRYLMQKWNISGPKIESLIPSDNDVVSIIDEVNISFDEHIFAANGMVSIRNVATDAVIHSMDINTSSEMNITSSTLNIDLDTPITAQGQYYFHIENGTLVDGDNLPFFELEDPTRFNLTIDPNPFLYNGLQLWLDASDTGTITSAAGKVSNWLDKSGNTRHASQADVNEMPDIGLVTQNGLDTVSFVDDTFELEDEDFQAVEIIQVFQVASPADFDTPATILSNYQDIERGHKFQNGSALFKNSPVLDYVQRNLVDITSSLDLFPTNFFSVTSIVQNHYNPTFDHNIGADSSSYFRGNLAELMVFDRRLSDADRNQLIDDLSDKWDIDLYPPSILTTNPLDEATTTDIYQDLTITFDEAVYPNLGNISIIRKSDGYVLDVIEVNSSRITGWGTDTITIDVLPKLLLGSNLYVTIEEFAIADASFNRIPAFGLDQEAWDFFTERDPNDIFFRWKAF